MNKINILYCIEFLNLSGTEKQLMQLMAGLDRDIFQPHLCCLRTSAVHDVRKELADDLFQKMDCPKIRLDFVSFRQFSSWIDIFRLAWYIRRHRIDIVQTFFQDPAAVGLIASKIAGVERTVASFRDLGFWREPGSDFFRKGVYRRFARYLANSRAVMNVFHDLYGLPLNKFAVIYNGLSPEAFPFQEKQGPAGKSETVVGILANLNREVKRVDVFLKAAHHVGRSLTGVRFVIAGDGELKPGLNHLCAELGLSDLVEFLGQVDDIGPLLARMDVGVISSDSEGFSNAILEYMAAGVPVVATDAGGNAESITDGVNGFLVPPGDHVSLGDRIIALLRDRDLSAAFRKNGYDMVKERYTLAECIRSHQDFYQSLINSHGV